MPDYPAGLIPVLADPFPALHGRRTTSYTVELRKRDGTRIATLNGVTGGSVEYDYSTRLFSGGKLSVEDTGQDINWLNSRVAISVTVNGTSWDVGLFIPTMPGANWAQGHRSWDVELHSILLVLDQSMLEASYTVKSGDSAVAAVKAVIADAGETSAAIEDGTEVLQSSMTWPPATPRLDIVNDLLQAAGRFKLQVDGSGNLIAAEYAKPQDRAVNRAVTFKDGENCIYVDDFTDSIDLFSIPNKIVAVGKGTGSLPGWIGSAVNDDPNDPYSTVSRGRDIVKPYTNVESTGSDSITRFAEQRLAEDSAPHRTIQIKHAPMNVQVASVVPFIYSAGDIDGLFVIDKTGIELDPLGLQTTVLSSV